MINIGAGFLIGVLQHGMDLQRAVKTYTILTIGDGLVTVIPALMISVSGGLVVTRAGSESRLSVDFQKQLFGNASVLMLVSAVLALFSLIPGLPTVPFLALSVGLGAIAWPMRKKEALASQTAELAKPKTASDAENLESLLRTEPLGIEVGLGLVQLVDGGAESPLMKRIGAIRRQLASELGYLLPPVRVNDNLSLRPREYLIQLRGAEIARYELVAGHELGIPSGKVEAALSLRPTKEPAFELEAYWIPKEKTEQALRAGYTLVEDVGVVGTHLIELIRRHAHELFSRQDTKVFCERVSRDSPKVVEDLVPKVIPLATVQRVLQNLLRERVPIRDGVGILEALGEAAAMTKNPVLLTEYVRQSIRRSLLKGHLTAKGQLPAYLLDPTLEQAMEGAIEHGEHASSIGMNPEMIRDLIERVRAMFPAPQAGAVIVTSSGARHFLRQILESSFPNVVVFSHNEIPPDTAIHSLGLVGLGG